MSGTISSAGRQTKRVSYSLQRLQRFSEMLQKPTIRLKTLFVQVSFQALVLSEKSPLVDNYQALVCVSLRIDHCRPDIRRFEFRFRRVRYFISHDATSSLPYCAQINIFCTIVILWLDILYEDKVLSCASLRIVTAEQRFVTNFERV